jgi:hypothetical protein
VGNRKPACAGGIFKRSWFSKIVECAPEGLRLAGGYDLAISLRSSADYTELEDASPISERETLENILLKRQIGLPVTRALAEAGYGAADVSDMSPESAAA